MPRVPTVTTQSVDPIADQTPFQTARGATPDAFGAQVARAMQNSARGLASVADDLRVMVDKDNERAAKQKDIELSQRQREIMEEFRSLRGQAAMDARDATVQRLKSAREEVEGSIENSAVRGMFSGVADVRGERALGAVSSYFLQQRPIAEREVTQSRQAQAASDAAADYRNPQAISQSLAMVQLEEERLARETDGVTDEGVIKQRVQDAQTAVHQAVINGFISEEDYTAAQEYLDGVENINGIIRNKIQGAINKQVAFNVTDLRPRVTEAVRIMSQSGKPAEGTNELVAKLQKMPGKRAARELQRLNTALEVQSSLAGWREKPMAARVAEYDEIRSKPALTDADNRMRIGMQRALSHARTEIAAGRGLKLAIDEGVIEADLPAFSLQPEVLSKYRAAASEASKFYSSRIDPIMPAQRKAILSMLEERFGPDGEAVDATEKVSIMSAIHQGLGDGYTTRLLADMAKEDQRTVFPLALHYVASGRSDVAQEIISAHFNAGDQQVDQATVDAAYDKVFGNVYNSNDAFNVDRVKSAAKALIALELKRTGATADGKNFSASVAEDVMARLGSFGDGTSVKSNGRSIFPLRPGGTQDQFDAVTENMRDAHLWGQSIRGGSPLAGDGTLVRMEEFNTGILGAGSHYRWVSVGDNGLYAIEDQAGRRIMDSTDTSKPYIINLRDLEPLATNADFDQSQLDDIDFDPESVSGEITPVSERAAIDPPSQPVEVGGVSFLPEAFRSRIMAKENSIKAGFDHEKQVWMPHKSVEGGSDTLAYGHKLTDKEISSGKIKIGTSTVSWRKGITEQQARTLLRDDIATAVETAAGLVDNFNEIDPVRRSVMVELAFILGHNRMSQFRKSTIALVEKGEWEKAARSLYSNRKFRRQIGTRMDEMVERLLTGASQ